MKYLVVMPEVAYITHNVDEEPILDSWDAPKGKWFKPAKGVEIPEEMNASEAFKSVEIVDKIV